MIEFKEEDKAAAFELIKETPEFSGFVEQFKSKVSEFRENNIQLQQKLQQYDGVDVTEYKKLKEHKPVDNSDTVNQLQQQLAQLNAQITERDTEQNISKAIASHSGAAPVNAEAAQLLAEKIKANSKLVDGKLIMLNNNGNDFVTEDGLGSVNQWIEQVARKQYPFLFSVPSGGGASGSTASGGGAKTISRADFEAIKDPRKRVEVAKSYTIV